MRLMSRQARKFIHLRAEGSHRVVERVFRQAQMGISGDGDARRARLSAPQPPPRW